VALIWLATAGCICFLLFAWLLPQRLYIVWRPYRIAAVISFFGRVFTFHMGVALGMATAAAFVLRRRRLALLAGIAAVAALWPTLWSLRPRQPLIAAGPTVRVMAMNLYAFNQNDGALTAAVDNANPDVIVLEEFTPFHQRVLDRALGDRFPYRALEPRQTPQGLGIYSRLPFVEPPRVQIDGFHMQIRTAVSIDGQPIALYALHPRSPQSVWAIVVNRLQTLDLLRQVRTETIPTILAGDFNFTETTANAAAFRGAGLRSTHDLAGLGRGSTRPVLPRWRARLPGVRIDHIFLTPQLTCTRDAVGEFDGSDHLPIYADVAIARSVATARPTVASAICRFASALCVL
jgi:endonuclease/exonuclease/phosphatase (EEP) superfamily protein YafD